jgi:hypothetical protein
MVTPPSSLTPLLTSPLESQCGPPFQPTVWQDLTSVVRRPQRWQIDSSGLSSKTTKIPLWFHQQTTTVKSSHKSLQRGLASHPPSLPKGWVYKVGDVSIKTEAEVVNPNSYLTLSAPLTHLKCRHLLDDQHADLYCQHCQASNTTEAPLTSPSASKRMAVKRRRVTSGLTSTHLTPL